MSPSRLSKVEGASAMETYALVKCATGRSHDANMNDIVETHCVLKDEEEMRWDERYKGVDLDVVERELLISIKQTPARLIRSQHPLQELQSFDSQHKPPE
jgi:hypothetical protein